MLAMRDGHAEMEVTAGAQGAGQMVTLEFPGKVKSATPLLRGFLLRYGDLEHVPHEDHHIAQLAIDLQLPLFDPPGISGSKVSVWCVINLNDENGDDPIAGTVDFTVIADIEEVEAPRPTVIEPTD